MRQSHDDILVGAELEVVGLDVIRVSLDEVRRLASGENLLKVPLDDVWACGGDDAGLLNAGTRVEFGLSKGHALAGLVVELGDVFRCKGQATRLRFGIGSEGLLEAKFALVLARLLLGVDEEEVCAAGRQDPAAISRDVEPMIGSPRAGMCVFALMPRRSKRRISPLLEATAM